MCSPSLLTCHQAGACAWARAVGATQASSRPSGCHSTRPHGLAAARSVVGEGAGGKGKAAVKARRQNQGLPACTARASCSTGAAWAVRGSTRGGGVGAPSPSGPAAWPLGAAWAAHCVRTSVAWARPVFCHSWDRAMMAAPNTPASASSGANGGHARQGRRGAAMAGRGGLQGLLLLRVGRVQLLLQAGEQLQQGRHVLHGVVRQGPARIALALGVAQAQARRMGRALGLGVVLDQVDLVTAWASSSSSPACSLPLRQLNLSARPQYRPPCWPGWRAPIHMSPCHQPLRSGFHQSL